MIKNLSISDVVYDKHTLVKLGTVHSISSSILTLNGKAPINIKRVVIVDNDGNVSRRTVGSVVTKAQIDDFNSLCEGRLLLVRKKICLVLKKKDKFCLILNEGRLARLNYWASYDIIR